MKGWQYELPFSHEQCKNLKSFFRTIFVFGANEDGRHGKGAALYARKHHGAVYGQGVGLQGNSYAIPTKNKSLIPLSLVVIKKYVDEFIEFAKRHPEMTFNITAIGCGFTGYKPEQIAPMFKGVPGNCVLPEDFKKVYRGINNVR